MRDYITLGSVPVEEDCVGVSDYEGMRQECRRYKVLLEKKFPNPPEGCYFGIKSFPHDFGTYMEVVIYFDDEKPETVEFAFDVEANLPLRWED